MNHSGIPLSLFLDKIVCLSVIVKLHNATLVILHFAIRSPKILKNLSKFNLFILDLEKIIICLFDLKQLVLEFFTSVPFLGHPVQASFKKF